MFIASLEVSALLLLFFSVSLLLRRLLLRSIRKEISSSKKVPMTICDKGHVYPSEASLHIEVPELPDKLELCPFCFDDNMKKAERTALESSK